MTDSDSTPGKRAKGRRREDHPGTQVLSRGFDPRLSVGSARPAVFRSSTYVFSSPEAAERAFATALGKRTPEGKVIETDRDFVMHLMDAHGVATVHGEAYGLSPHFRISIAASLEDIRRGCERIQRAANDLA